MGSSIHTRRLIRIPRREDVYGKLPNLTRKSGEIEEVRGGDPSRFFAPMRGGVQDPIVRRANDVPRCRLCNSDLGPIANLTITNIPFTAGHASLVDNDHFLDPQFLMRAKITTPGRYLVNTRVIFASNAAGTRSSWLEKNGSAAKRFCEVYIPAIAGGNVTPVQISQQVDLVAGGYFQLYCYQDSGGSLSLSLNGGLEECTAEISMCLISSVGGDT